MKRVNNFAFQQGILSAEVCVPSVCQVVSVVDDSELNRLLKIVFAPNDDGIVDGDLAYSMSKEADPQIVQFIKSVLQTDMSSFREPSIPDGMSDEDVELYSFHLGETRQEYAERMADIIRVQRNEIEHSENDVESNEN